VPESASLLRPSSGHVVALRPDMTPQIARVAATRYAGTALPLRLMYEGSVIRTPRGRSRKLRQISQAGVELIGWASIDADVEVIRVALAALAALGLEDVRVELSHATVANALVALASEPLRAHFIDALSARDDATLRRVLGDGPALDRVRATVALAGDSAVLDGDVTHTISTSPAVSAALDELRAVRDRLAASGLADRVLVDLGEVRGLGYYTGVSFVLLARGVGEPLGAGGRYDSLLAEFGAPRPATGCAIDLELVDEALAQTTPAAIERPTLLVGSATERDRAARALRARGIAVAECDEALFSLADAASLSRYARVLRCEGDAVYERGDDARRDWLSRT
jgi:ATP phosphoribosyltransferase regulatory subunit